MSDGVKDRSSDSAGAPVAPLDYRTAGVDIDIADEAKRRMRALVDSTRTAGTLGTFGAFGGMFRAPDGRHPVLVASADGVGTKIKVAIEAGQHATVGHDLVNHCVNDILALGAAPLFFLDYVAFGVLDPVVAEAIVAGVAAGCRENGCALLGGETAEMPGLYTPPDYDLAGFIVGCVEEEAVLGPERVAAGDVLVALESTGLHTNGYALARRIVRDRLRLEAHDVFPGEGVATVADVLLRVHRSYLRVLRPSLGRIHALAHITGGGIPGNLNRVLPSTLDAEVRLDTWRVPNVFRVLQEAGPIAAADMYQAFNMGVGMIVVTPGDVADQLIAEAAAAGIPAWRAGEIVAGVGRVRLLGL
jgi:phosphoribosylformylglycinamidine cyclo-ligase